MNMTSMNISLPEPLRRECVHAVTDRLDKARQR